MPIFKQITDLADKVDIHDLIKTWERLLQIVQNLDTAYHCAVQDVLPVQPDDRGLLHPNLDQFPAKYTVFESQLNRSNISTLTDKGFINRQNDYLSFL